VEREGVPDISWVTEMAVLAAPYKNVYAEIGTTFASTVITFPTVCAHILGQLLKFMGEDRVVFGSDAVWYGSPQWQIEALWRFQIPEDMRRKYGYPKLTEEIRRKILGLNSARLYGIKPGVVTPRPHDHHHHHDKHDHHGHHHHDHHPHHDHKPRDGVYYPIPSDYESRITPELKRILEYPATTAALSDVHLAQYTEDNLAKMKESYTEHGGYRSNTRYGWMKNRA
jgi:hypothetical protein